MTDNKGLVGVFGAGGQMGQAIVEQLSKFSDLKLGAQIDKGSLKDFSKRKPTGTIDVVIDFSSPEGTMEICQWCVENKVPLVVGTTGLNPSQSASLVAAARKIPLFVSPNMSTGVFGLTSALRAFLEVVKDGEIFIEEIHHLHKKDAPSGTAKAIHELIKDGASPNIKVSEPTSVRAGDVFGIHRINFFAEGERISFEHHATSRSVFAKGAVTAAQWLLNQRPGLYQMKDMLTR